MLTLQHLCHARWTADRSLSVCIRYVNIATSVICTVSRWLINKWLYSECWHYNICDMDDEPLLSNWPHWAESFLIGYNSCSVSSIQYFCGTARFITLFTRARRWSATWAQWSQSRNFFPVAQQPIVGQGLIIEASWWHSITHNTNGRAPLDEWSAQRRDLYLTTHGTHKIQTPMSPVGFEPTILASEGPQNHTLDRAVTGISFNSLITTLYL
jgi:hypothetical protein